MACGGIVYVTNVAATVAAAKAAAAAGLHAVWYCRWQKCRSSKGGGEWQSWSPQTAMGCLLCSDAHLFSSTRDEEKQGKQNWYFCANKNVRFVSAVPKVVLQKIKNKTEQMLGLMAFSGNEGMGGQRRSNTQETRNALYF